MTIKQVDDAILLLKNEGSNLAKPVKVPGFPDMTFACTFSESGTNNTYLSSSNISLPDDLKKMWQSIQWAKIFEDTEYGQWGLSILTIDEAQKTTEEFKEERPQEFEWGDFIVAEFLGDSDLLLVRCDQTKPDYGKVIVVLPLDKRSDWYLAANSIGDFLSKYAKSGGEKFWTILKK